MRLGFIGAGNMGTAIINGFIQSNKVLPSNINVIRKNKEALAQMTKDIGINGYENYNELIANSDILFLAIKPNLFSTIINEIKPYTANKDITIVSIAAGLTIDNITSMFGYDCPVIRIMPNINAEVSMSATAICNNTLVNQSVLASVISLFDSIGNTYAIDESQFSIFTAIAGCSPAYVYLFIDSLAKGALKMGMNKKQALDIATTAIIGSCKMFQQSNAHPGDLIDRVCSPGGTTIAGLTTLDEYKFTAAVVKAVENSILKDKEINNKDF